MPDRRAFFSRFFSIFVSFAFLLTTLPAFTSPMADTLAPRMYSGMNHADIPREVIDEMQFLSVCVSIADHFFKHNGSEEDLSQRLLESFYWDPAVLARQQIDLSNLRVVGQRDLRIPFTSRATGRKMLLNMTHDPFSSEISSQKTKIGPYVLSIMEDTSGSSLEERDLKGFSAETGRIDWVIREIIDNEEMLEIVLDPETGELKAFLLKFGDGHGPFPDTGKVYYQREWDLSMLFTRDERERLKSWMLDKENLIWSEPITFRLALGRAALNWEGDIESSHIVHAGVMARTIYMGSVLLKYMLREAEKSLMKKVLSEDEVRHLKGFGHGSEEQVRQRLDLVASKVASSELILEKLKEKDVWWLKDNLSVLLEEEDLKALEEFLITADSYLRSLSSAPVEVGYPVKKAVALLNREEQDKFSRMLFEESSVLNVALTGDLLLMLLPSLDSHETGFTETEQNIAKWLKTNWVPNFSPALEGRTVWQVSPEIWHEAGGLARVMQYHGAAKNEILSEHNVRHRQVEPHYPYRVNAKLEVEEFDYSRDITHPLRDMKNLTETDPAIGDFTVKVGDKDVQVEVHKGVNDLGIEDYIIRDVQEDGSSFYTHSLYNYRNDPFDPNPELPTWTEFSVFFSRASLELIRRIENREREQAIEEGRQWKAPLVHTNDSQTALTQVYRRIELDSQLRRREQDSSFQVDPVLADSVFFFTTHTYGNRRDNLSPGELDFMGISEPYKRLFHHTKRVTGPDGRKIEVACLDMASAGLRTAHGQNGVAWAHTQDVKKWDEWINDAANPSIAHLREALPHADLVVRLQAIANGDHREKTAMYFRKYLNELDGHVDVEHPTAFQIARAKSKAKRALTLKSDSFVWSEEMSGGDFTSPLNEDQLVISYSGRLVWEKAGRGFSGGRGDDDRGALTDTNIIELVKRGVQVVFYGNVQTNDAGSVELYRGLKRLALRIKGLKKGSPIEYPGNLIVVPRFSLDQQRRLLAASDIGVHDSYPATEAAGFTEADDAVCGGLVVAPVRTGEFFNDGLGEGLFQAQGESMDFDNIGRGNTLVPEELTSESYLDIMLRAVELYDPFPADNRLGEYQATSVRFSRILNSRLTAIEYLRAFNNVILEREARRVGRSDRKKEQESAGYKNSLLGQLSQENVSVRYVGTLTEHLFRGEVNEAIDAFYTEGILSVRENMYENVIFLMNMILSSYHDKNISPETLQSFLGELGRTLSPVLLKEDMSSQLIKDLQLIIAQTESIAGWMDRGVKGAEDYRLTHDLENMEVSDRGRSFIDRRSFEKHIPVVEEEGAHGFYFRGTETIPSKLSNVIISDVVLDPSTLSQHKEASYLYHMNHGFVEVPEDLKPAGSALSTIHETVFLRDDIPGSLQRTSTGVGHFQGLKLDIKQATSGAGLQVNVRYDDNGNIVEILAQEVEAGDWFFALPGYVDYVINLGDFKFNDISYTLTEEEANSFLPEGETISKEPEKAVMKAPLAGIISAEEAPYLVNTLEDAPEINWIKDTFSLSPDMELLDFYSRLNLDKLSRYVGKIQRSIKELRRYPATPDIPVIEEFDKTVFSGEVPKERLFKKAVEVIRGYTRENEFFLNEFLSAEEAGPKLFRVPREFIDIVGIENIRGLLEVVQAADGLYLEVYSLEHPEGFFSDPYGVVTKALPETLEASERSRANTITIFPVEKNEKLSSNRNKRWAGQDHQSTIITPVGYNFDKAGLVRSFILGLRLSEINRLGAGAQSSLTKATLRDYITLCRGLNQDTELIKLKPQDLVDIARGEGVDAVNALNRLIELLPIVPLDVEHLRTIYDGAKEIFISA